MYLLYSFKPFLSIWIAADSHKQNLYKNEDTLNFVSSFLYNRFSALHLLAQKARNCLGQFILNFTRRAVSLGKKHDAAHNVAL